MSVVTKAKAIADIDSNAEEKLTSVLPLATIKIRNILGEDEYAACLLLDEGNQQKEDVEYAEAYYSLYYLAIALKKLQANAVTAARIGFDKGQINPSVIDELNKLRESYKAEADDILAMYATNANGGGGVRFYSI